MPEGFPAKRTVFDSFQKWNEDSTLIRINDVLRERVRATLGRDTQPSTAIVDSQSVTTTEAGGDSGCDAGKKIKGRKRHLIVDTHGRVLRVLVHAADSSERAGGIWRLNEHREERTFLNAIRVDQGYKAMFVAWVHPFLHCTVEVIEKPKDHVGFAVLPKRWVIERTFAWLGRYRQVSKEYDRRPESTEAWIYLASIDILLKRLHPSV